MLRAGGAAVVGNSGDSRPKVLREDASAPECPDFLNFRKCGGAGASGRGAPGRARVVEGEREGERERERERVRLVR